MSAAEALSGNGVSARVVSIPSTDVFDSQDQAYRDAVLPPSVRPRVAIEAGVSDCWWRYVGDAGRVIGIDRFGLSAPAPTLFEHFGFTVDNVLATVQDIL